MATVKKVSRLKAGEFKLNTLLDITKAINNNLPEGELFSLFQGVLKVGLNIGKAIVFINQDEAWPCVLHYGANQTEIQLDVEKELSAVSDITVLDTSRLKGDSQFDVVIPVFHRSKKIAYVMLGDLDEDELKISPIVKHLSFIQTLANIIVVAVENKRLVKESIEREHFQKQLAMAREIQETLLPDILPDDSELQIASHYQPHSEVGGDLYDVIKISENETIFCLADISGKGMSAALLMANFQANLRAFLSVDSDLTSLLLRLNERMWNTAKGDRFVTLFVAKYNKKTHWLEYINAAHPPPIMIENGYGLELRSGCVGLGMFEEIPSINVGKIKVKKDAILVCFTDGLSEVENVMGEQFNEKGLTEIVCSRSFSSMKDLNEVIIKELHDYKGQAPFEDDIALISCRFF